MKDGRIAVLRHTTPVGDMLIGTCGGSLCMSDWCLNGRAERTLARMAAIMGLHVEYGVSDAGIRAVEALDAYFQGDVATPGADLLMGVGTEFQKRVWSELMRIPYGSTVSYTGLARRIGCATGVRAVASACRANVMSIFIPCHRVIGSDGSLRGYTGGIDSKEILLAMERERVSR